MKILLGTDNDGKLREMRAILASLPAELVSPAEIGLDIYVEEEGSTYSENATLKAGAYSQASGLIALADDSGLEVDCLGGEPGVYSKRYLPKPDATDAERRAYLLQKLRDKPRPWLAHFHCTVAVVAPGRTVRLFDGDCFGEIIPEERGQNGFGYDPIFLLREINCTMAELSMEEKNRVSHRSRALREAYPALLRLINEGG